MAVLSSVPRHRRRLIALPQLSNAPTLLAVVLAIIVGLGLWWWLDLTKPLPYLGLAREVQPGAVLTREDLAPVEARFGQAETQAAHVPWSEVDQVVGQVLREPGLPSQLVLRRHLQPWSVAPELVWESFAVRPEHAVAGSLTPGQPILVILTRPGRAPEVVLDGVRIQAVARAGGLLITVAVPREQAWRLLEAKLAGELHVLALAGGARSPGPAVRDGLAPAGALLPAGIPAPTLPAAP